MLTMISCSLVAHSAQDSAQSGSDSLSDKSQSDLELWIRLLQITLVVYWL